MRIARIAALAGLAAQAVAAVGAAESAAASAAGASTLFGAERTTRMLTAAEFKEAVSEEWERDYAIMLMASWCRYCRQFKPIWTAVSKWFGTDSTLEVVMFDCEAAPEHQKLCASVGVKHYPSVLFAGHGSYHAADPLSVALGKVAKGLPPRTVMYPGDLFFESVRDWARTMRFLSRCSRWSNKLGRALGFGGGAQGSGSAAAAKATRLAAENAKLRAAALKEAAVKEQREKVESSNAQIAAKYATGLDAYEVLSSLDYGLTQGGAPGKGGANLTMPDGAPSLDPEAVAAVKRCVTELTAQYCEARGEGGRAEPHCARVVDCWKTGFQDETCRPSRCPLHQPGCDVAAICLHKDVLTQFVNKAKKEDEARAAKQGAATGAPPATEPPAEAAKAKAAESVEEEDEVDPAVVAAARAASAAATGIGGGGEAPAGRAGRGPRRRDLWEKDAKAPAEGVAA